MCFPDIPLAPKYNLMQLLTNDYTFYHNNSFEPLSIVGIGLMVVAERYYFHENRKTYLVHVWTLENGTLLTEVKQYLNTVVTITCNKKPPYYIQTSVSWLRDYSTECVLLFGIISIKSWCFEWFMPKKIADFRQNFIFNAS